MQNKFKVGDKVRRIGFCSCHPNCCEDTMGMEVKITYVGKRDGEHPYWIEDWKHSAAECELELVQEEVPAFKVGDKVKLLESCSLLNVGEIAELNYGTRSKNHIYELWAWGEKGECLHESNWELVKEPKRISTIIKFRKFTEPNCSVVQEKPKQTIMTKLTNAVKKFLSPDLQTQIKAGFRSEGTLELTSDGKTAAIEALLDANLAAMTAFTAAANEIVVEQEKTK